MSIVDSLAHSPNKEIDKDTDRENVLLTESSKIVDHQKSNRELEERINNDFALYMDTTNKINESINSRMQDTPRDLFRHLDKNKLKQDNYTEFQEIEKKLKENLK